MSKILIVGVILAAAVAGFAGAHYGQMWNRGPSWAGGWGPGMMARGGYGPGSGVGPGIMGPGLMGPGMGGFGGGMMGRGDWDERDDLNLTADQVTRRFERRLAMHGNSRVKLGAVAEKDARTITVDIVTTDNGGLVQRFGIDRKTGLTRPIDG